MKRVSELDHVTASETLSLLLLHGEHCKPAGSLQFTLCLTTSLPEQCGQSKNRSSDLSNCFSLPFSSSLGVRGVMTQQEGEATAPVTGTKLPVSSCLSDISKKTVS